MEIEKMGTKGSKEYSYNFIQAEMYDLALAVNHMRKCYTHFPKEDDMTSVYINHGKVCFKWETDGGCGDYDTEEFHYPASYLDNPQWMAVEEKAIADKKKEEDEKWKLLQIEQAKDRKLRLQQESNRITNRLHEIKKELE